MSLPQAHLVDDDDAIRDALAWHLDGDPGPDLPPVLTRRRAAYRHAVAYTHDLHRD